MEKVLIADFSSGKDRVTVRGLWQFDRGVKLKVIGINAADVNRVDFAPVIASEAVPVVVTPDEDGTFTVSIPGGSNKKPLRRDRVYLCRYRRIRLHCKSRQYAGDSPPGSRKTRRRRKTRSVRGSDRKGIWICHKGTRFRQGCGRI